MSATIDNRVYDELEALEAILIEDFAVKHEDGVPRIIETVVHPSTGDQIDQQYVCLTLEVKLSPDYPDTIPEVFLRNPRGLDDKLLNNINSRIKNKLDRHIGNPIVFELIEIVREYLTACNLPRGQCAICLHGFVKGDVFVKTPCYHHFHSHCFHKHLVNSRKYYEEEMEKLPNWQRAQAPEYQQTCPVCRNVVSFDEKVLEQAPPPVESLDAPPFRLTPEMKALQRSMSEVLERQIARGGVVGMGDDGPPLLTITTSADKEKASTSGTQGAKAEANRAVPSTSAENPEKAQPYSGPYRPDEDVVAAALRGDPLAVAGRPPPPSAPIRATPARMNPYLIYKLSTSRLLNTLYTRSVIDPLLINSI
ncbi:E3 ubiquitin-protein ligase RNF25 [Danaus plexippus plexippus]|uniref:E3 ubiquitin-protein ligase RNF25 n=1 Tax=Danaus plexippus plexippus TaxID=278856 RepID=A0A212FA89_DANPL|nr:E3 ubiquitin-protein ligase RNF25 [Danaus plexippus plexippus]